MAEREFATFVMEKSYFGRAIRKGLFKQKAFGLRKSVAFEGSL